MESRRDFIKKIAAVLGIMAIDQEAFGKPVQTKAVTLDPKSTVYRAINGKPDENLIKVIDLMGGIEKIVASDDIVLIKPNLQWWNQGAPNLLALKTFVDLIMERPGGFKGEVVIAENCHRGARPWQSTSTGWASPFEWNADLPGVSHYNDLCAKLKGTYGERFSVSHWIDVDVGGKRVYGPEVDAGYVYCDGTVGVSLIRFDNGLRGKDSRATIMTYPIWKTDKGTIIDLKNGIWEKGVYTGRPLKFINFAALNHHSTYCGATSAVKNYLGITDLSGGPDPQDRGKLTENYYNFHSFPLNKWAPGPAAGMIGAEVGFFMKAIRRADLNITTAEWVGLASRTVPPIARTRAVLASTDPVALDYSAFKYVLYPNSGFSVHNPDHVKSPVRLDLSKCAEQGGGVLDEKYVKVESYDFATGRIQRDEDLVIHAEKQWGTNPKAILKYLYLRYGPS
jgi:hypothetical protein